MTVMTPTGSTTKILISVDGSEFAGAALHWAASLRHAGIALHCVLVYVQPPILSGEAGLVSPASAVSRRRDQATASVMKQAAEFLQARNLPHTLVSEFKSDIAATLLERAARHECEAVVVGRRGWGAIRAAVLGSVSAAVMQRAALPVIVVNRNVAPLANPPLRILLATDGSCAANRAAASAATLAGRADKGEVHVLHVRPDITVAEAIFGPTERLIEQWSAPHEAETIESAREIIARTGSTCLVFPGVAGDARRVISRAAREGNFAMIALGMHGLGSVSTLLAGSVAQHIVKEARVPVLLAR